MFSNRKPMGIALPLLSTLLTLITAGSAWSQTATTTTLAVTPSPVTYGQTATLTATVSPSGATGNVTFYDGAAFLGVAPVSGGSAVFRTIALSPGNHSLHARYDGSSVYVASASASVAETVKANAGGKFAAGPTLQSSTPVFATADFNNDGKLDLVAGYYLGGFEIYLGNGDGTFETGQLFSISAGVGSFKVADLNGDGKPDIVVGDTQYAYVLTGNGDGTFQTPQQIAGLSGISGLELADVNEDGIVDLITATSYTGLSVSLGNGDSTFGSPVPAASLSYTVGFVSGDFNGDGHVDFAAVDQSGVVWIFLGQGDATFEQSYKYFEEEETTRLTTLLAADLNGDGKTDLVYSFGGVDAIVLLGNGDGTVRFAVSLPSCVGEYGCYTEKVVESDFNGDGKPDLMLINSNWPSATYYGNGDGTFGLLTYSFDGRLMSEVVGDFNGDGIADFIGQVYPDNQSNDVLLGTFASPITLTGSPNPVPFPNSFVLTATVSQDATGTVDFDYADGSSLAEVPVVSGTASTTVSGQQTGTLYYSATYNGDSTHPSSTSGVLPVTAEQPITLTLAASKNPITVGQTETFTVNTDFFEFVTFFDGTQILGTVSIVASGTFSLATLGPGTHHITASVPYRNGYLAASASVDITVNPIAGGTLTAEAPILAGVSPSYLVSADFDVDGFADIAVTSADQKTLTLLRGRGDGTFQTFSNRTLFYTPGPLAFGLLIEDGTPSVAILDPMDDAVYLQQVNAFSDASPALLVGSNPSGIAIADFDNDSRADIATANSGGNTISVLLANPDDLTFHSQVAYPTGLQPAAIAAADFNLDGNADLVVSNQGSNSLSIFLGKGDGTFGPGLTAATGVAPGPLAVGDLNSDGKSDLAVANTGDNTIAVFFGIGDGSFQAPVIYSASAGIVSMAISDLNSDGKMDLVVSGSSGVFIYYGTGSGALGPATVLSGIGSSGMIVTGVFSGEGREDFAVAEPDASLVGLVAQPTSDTLSLTASLPAPVIGQTLTLTATVSPNNVSGKIAFYDGVSLLAVASLVNGKATYSTSLLLPGSHVLAARLTSAPGYAPTLTTLVVPVSATAQTGFPGAALTQSTASSFAQLIPGDFNRDGIEDLAGYSSGPIYILTGSSNGAFQASVGNTNNASGPWAISDFNSDGISDIATLAGGYDVAVFTGNGDGSFGFDPLYSGSPFYQPSALVTADFNGDGKADLVAIQPNPESMSLALGNGDATFQAPRTLSQIPGLTTVITTDLNSDGKADLVFGSQAQGAPGSINVMLGNGDGTFGAVQSFAAASSPLWLVAGDFNGDGKPDIAVVNPGIGSLGVLLGNGDGTLGAATYYLVGKNPSQIITTDLNGDGILDLLLIDATSLNAYILFGNGDGSFGTAVAFPAPFTPVGIAVGDFNRDGRMDFAVESTTQSTGTLQVYLGSSSALTLLQGSPQSAETGQPFPVALEVGAPAGIPVTFSAPASGASGTFGGLTSTTVIAGADNTATAPIFTANSIQGSYKIQATGTGSVVVFSLTNLGCPFTVSATVLPNVDSNGGSDSFTFTANGPSCPWTATTNANWVSIPNASGSGNGSLTVNIAPNTTGMERTASIYLGDQTITVTQWETAQVFTDVPPSDYYFDAVNLLKNKSVTSGCGPTTYCPTDNVTRAQMAVFIVRAVIGSDNFSYSPTPYFTDVPVGSFGFAWIQKMYELQITSGCGPNIYCPDATISRDQMAVFIIRARYGASTTFDYPPTPFFTDVPVGAFAFAWIQRMKADTITSGCSATLYCPGNPVTRGDMAIFIMRGLFNQLLPAGFPVITSITPASILPGQTVTATITGANAAFVQGSTVVQPMPGISFTSINVLDANTLSTAVTASPTAPAQPVSIWVTTPNVNDAVLPNGLLVQ